MVNIVKCYVMFSKMVKNCSSQPVLHMKVRVIPRFLLLIPLEKSLSPYNSSCIRSLFEDLGIEQMVTKIIPIFL